MNKTVYLVAANEFPSITIDIERDNAAVDLTNAVSVSLIIKEDSTGTITQAAGSASISSPATNGQVSYSIIAADFPRQGNYSCDVKILWSGSKTEILYDQLRVVARAKN